MGLNLPVIPPKSVPFPFDAKVKNSDEISNILEFELRDIMCECCGVIRDKNKIKLGLEKIEEIKECSKKYEPW